VSKSDPPQPIQQPAYRPGTATFLSPLRYPGGKRKLANFVSLLFRANQLMDGVYAEAYAGGAAVALAMLYGDYARSIHINDWDPGVHAFWVAARDQTIALCRLIRGAELTVDEWERQREVQGSNDPDPLELAFSTFYLNRTNRSGIVTGGLIGGLDQTGGWKMDARFKKDDLVGRVERIGRWRSRINIYRLDGADFLSQVVQAMPEKSLTYLDPPYYVKGKENLYANYYRPEDHAKIAQVVRDLGQPWVISYDDVPEIRRLYRGFTKVAYGISYSAQERYPGNEVAFFSEGLTVPPVADPTRVTARDIFNYEVA
jgi:DNA adenine methylase